MQTNDRDYVIKENDVIIENITMSSAAGGGEIPIASAVSSIGFYENIFSPFITGTMTFIDGTGFMRKFPVIGREFVTITFRSPLDPEVKTITLRVCGQASKLSDKTKRVSIATLRLISLAGYYDLTRKFSKSFRGTNARIASDIVAEEYNGAVLEADETNGVYQYAFPYKRPSEMINQLCNLSYKDPDGVDTGYVFYETLSGFKFKNLSELYLQPEVDFFTNTKVNRPNSEMDDLTYSTHVARSLSYGKEFDRPKQILSGGFSSREILFDITRKDIQTFDTSYITDSFVPRLESDTMKPIVSANETESYSQSDIEIVNDCTSRYDEGYNDNFSVSRFKKINHALHNDTQRSIEISGNSKLEAGQTVSLQIMKDDTNTEVENEGESNPQESTKYLIKGLHHRIYLKADKSDEYKTSLELVRNFRGEPVPTSQNFSEEQ